MITNLETYLEYCKVAMYNPIFLGILALFTGVWIWRANRVTKIEIPDEEKLLDDMDVSEIGELLAEELNIDLGRPDLTNPREEP